MSDHGPGCGCCHRPDTRDIDEIRARIKRVYGPEERLSRRSFLKTVGAVATTGILAGCLGASDADNERVANVAGIDDTPLEIKGRLVVGEGMDVIEGTIHVEDGRIMRIVEEGVESDDIIIPAFVNTHTHITDSVAKDGARARDYSWEELFIDPGLKGEYLEEADQDEKREAMDRTLQFMKETGTGTFADFKEEGIQGVKDLNVVDESRKVDAVPLFQGEYLTEDDDLRAEIERAGGYQSYYPWNEQDERAREICDELGKVFALHSGEPGPDDIDDALALNPDYTSHMVHTREEDYEVLENNNIGISALPRSNLVILDKLPPLERLHEHTTVALGTDNVMLNSASMLREMEFTSKLFDIRPCEVLQMATINGAKLMHRANEIGSIEEGKRARLAILDTSRELKELRDPVAGVVRRATARDVKETVLL